MTHIISPRLLVIVPLVLRCSQVLAELMVCLAVFGVYSGLELARLGDVLGFDPVDVDGLLDLLIQHDDFRLGRLRLLEFLLLVLDVVHCT